MTLFFFFGLVFEQNFGYVYSLYKNESCKLNSCEWFLDRPEWARLGHFHSQLDPVRSLYYIGSCYQVFFYTGYILGRVPYTNESLSDFR